MNSNLIFSLISSVALIGLGFYFKYANEKANEQKQMVNGYFKKNWYIFVVVGIACLCIDIYRILK
ncbi:hypothetical protein [Pedobacter sp. UBA4863]|uniref:hypothetical protein n=1 Tax=Pedobacter sp. UBA4863 TaxID=1947060 RepID=UPI0025EA905B|nr:hypothetical protein [Pedobacter sp. UBA4863]